MSANDPLAEFEPGIGPETQKRVFAVKMAQQILSEKFMYTSESINLSSVLELSEYLLNGREK